MNEPTRAPGADELGRLEFVVENRRSDAHETVTPGTRVVLEAQSLRPIGVLERGEPTPNRPAGFNPYFDPPLAA